MFNVTQFDSYDEAFLEAFALALRGQKVMETKV